jgi:lipopolysaccharide export system protein LptC
MSFLALLRNVSDRLALYLPALVMGFFALGSWWLVRSVPDLHTPMQAKTVRKDPDYYLNGFSVKSFDATGRQSRELQGAQARHYPEFDILEIDTVQIHALSPEGDRLVARADHAVVQGESTHNDAEITLTGNANVVRDTLQAGPQTELRGQEITAFSQSQRVISDKPVELLRGKDVFTANTMNLNVKTGEYELKGRVKGVIMPSPSAR